MGIKSFGRDNQCLLISNNEIIMRNTLEKIILNENLKGPFPRYGEYYKEKFYNSDEIVKGNYILHNNNYDEKFINFKKSEFKLIRKNKEFAETYELIETGEKIRISNIYQALKMENIFLDRKNHNIKVCFNNEFKKWETNL